MDQQKELLKKKYDQLFELTLKMRQRQKSYFKYRVKSDLEAAKRYEREIDQLLKQGIELKTSKQQELF